MKLTEKYLFFQRDILSNWYPTVIHYEGNMFFSSEQLFMFLKAKLFKDDQAAAAILKARTPAAAKQLGRSVQNFNQDVWDKNKQSLMYKAVEAKAKANPEFAGKLLTYRDRTFVECNSHDNIWAIGLGEYDDRIFHPEQWRGQNLLGKTLNKLAAALYKAAAQ